MQDKRAEWIAWGLRQLGADSLPSLPPDPYYLWEEGYWALYDLVLDEYANEYHLDDLVESINVGDIAIMAAGLALEGFRDKATKKLLQRFDRRLARLQEQFPEEPYFVEVHCCPSDADPGL